MTKKSRGEKAFINTLMALVYEAVLVISGLILPRLILSVFGSAYNGITSSISQFLSCIALLKAGIGGVTQAALYKPLATNNMDEVSGIIWATERFMRRIAHIFAIGILVFACIYPIFVNDEFDWFFSFSLVLILGIGTFVQYYFGITYQLLLQANQSQWVESATQIITTILNTIIAAMLIYSGASIHVVKLGSALVFCLNPIIINFYVHRHYKLNRKIPVNESAIKQRWDAFAHELANFINTNTDIVILTVFTTLKEVSVYTVYYMIISGLSRLLRSTISGIRAAFGNMLSKREDKVIEDNFKIFELYMFSVASIFFITAAITIVPFVKVYTAGVTDVNYSRPVFAGIISLATFFSCIRIPYVCLVQAAGHFKQTRNGAILEAGLNILISITLVIKFGLIGVAIGTLCATIFRTIQYVLYLSSKVIVRKISIFIKHLLVSAGVLLLVIGITNIIPGRDIVTWLDWFVRAFLVFIITTTSVMISNLLFYREDSLSLYQKVKGILMRIGKRKTK